jgi:phosphoserine phosphatase RsbX
MRFDDWIEWDVRSRPITGEAVSGDVHVVEPCPSGLLVAAIDGLGHGEEAAEAANRARDMLRAAPEDPLDALVTRCHHALKGTRGAALTLAFIHRDGRLAWLGVGNVEAVLVRAFPRGRPSRDSLMLTSGIVGQQIQGVRVHHAALASGDMLVLATDGVRSSFIEMLTGQDTPARIAADVLARYGKPTDDVLVLAATYLRGEQ